MLWLCYDSKNCLTVENTRKTETLQPSLSSSSCFIRISFLNLICFYEKFQKGKQNFSTVECNHVEMLLAAYYDHIS